jgi:hypothetical protein
MKVRSTGLRPGIHRAASFPLCCLAGQHVEMWRTYIKNEENSDGNR